MKKQSLQAIEDFYLNLGYQGDRLRLALGKDKEFQQIIKSRKEKLSKKFNLTLIEKKKYLLLTDADFEILGKCKQLEKLNLVSKDKLLVKLIKSQLKADWRRPLLKSLNNLLSRSNPDNICKDI